MEPVANLGILGEKGSLEAMVIPQPGVLRRRRRLGKGGRDGRGGAGEAGGVVWW